MKKQFARAIVKKVQTLHKKQIKASKPGGFHHPVLHESTGLIQKLIKEFERITGKDWDKEAHKYI